ncbi:MAG: hypothetical protein H5U20_08470, partial [Rhodobacteraceae bacterium]|nr:hypothetical protein [Paracoccaceae bacterium]
MEEIAELERRIAEALERIGRGLERGAAVAPGRDDATAAGPDPAALAAAEAEV